MKVKESTTNSRAYGNIFSNSFSTLLDRWQIPEEIILTAAAIIVGSGTGIGAVLFIEALDLIKALTLFVRASIGDIPGLFLMMAASGLIVGYVVSKWASEAKGHGVPEVMEAIAIRGGRIRPRVAAIKVFASSLTIGTGGSAGREGPIVQVGSALGSTLGQVLHFSNERVRTLVACGAAAGIAATFNAPIAGSIFALEVILGRFTVRYFGAVVISAVSAGVIGRIYLGDKPAFNVPAYSLDHFGELGIYIILGILSALVAVAFIRLLYRAEELFDGWKTPQSIRAATGMILTAIVALPLAGQEVLGSGLDLIGETIAEDFKLPLMTLAALLVLKMLATVFTLGGGNSGGVFAPSLFMGAVLGGIVGTIGNQLFPEVVQHPGAYAIVGMAAVFSGAARAPITAVLIVFEMSNDYRLILPLMLATVTSTLLAESLFRESIYTLKLKLKGVALQSGRDIDVLQGVKVEEVMTRNPESVHHGSPITELANQFAITGHHGLTVHDDEKRFWGLVTINDLRRAHANGVSPDASVRDVAVPVSRLTVAFPDETLSEVMARMSTRGIGRLPVVSRADPGNLLGLIRREDVLHGYRVALIRRAEIQHRTKQLELRNLDNKEFIEFEIHPSSRWAGHTLHALAVELPTECVIVSLRRGGRILIPHGDTVFHAGDMITAFVESNARPHLAACLEDRNDEIMDPTAGNQSQGDSG